MLYKLSSSFFKMEVKDITSVLKKIAKEKEGAQIKRFEVTNYDEFYKESKVMEVDIKHKTEEPFSPTTERCETLSTNRTKDPIPLTYMAENTNEFSYTITHEKTTQMGFNGSITAKAMATLSAGIGFSANLTSRKSTQLRQFSSQKTTNVINYTVRPGYKGVLKRTRCTRKVIVPCRLDVKLPKAFKFKCKYRVSRKPRTVIEKYPEVKATAVFDQLPNKYWQTVEKRKSRWTKETHLEFQLNTNMEYTCDTCEYTVETEKI